MGHTPYGYKIENGKAVIDETAAEKLRILFDNYLNGLSLQTAAKAAGIKTMVLTGRECKATKRRLDELNVDYIFQNVKDKPSFLRRFCKEHALEKGDLGYIGDDLNDLEAMGMCGFVACPSDACAEVKEIANYVSDIKGGNGAVRNVIEHYLREKELWSNLVAEIYKSSGL